MSDLVSALLDSADTRPEAAAITAGGVTLTYGTLAERIRRAAGGLRAAGLHSGDRVLFSVRPGVDAVVLALGIVHADGVVVFADPGAGDALFRSRARLAAPRWVAAESLLYLASTRPLRRVARRRGLELAPYGRLVPDARHVRVGPWLPGVPLRARSARRLATSVSSGRVSAASGSSDAPAFCLDDEALVVFTSGTTDDPKAVVHSRGSLGAGLADFAAGVGIRAGHRVLTDQLMVGIPALIAGAHWTLPPAGANPGARPEDYLRLLPDAEFLFASPAAIDAMLHALDAHPELTPRRLDTIALGGAPVLRPLLRRIHERFPDAAIRSVYGMTEILPVAIADGVAKLRAGRGGVSEGGVSEEGVGEGGVDEGGVSEGSGGDVVGRVVPSVHARIDDGELVLSGPGLARGYLADLPEHPLSELRTGDLARIDDGLLTLLGRRKDMFIRGTQNVYPGLYEPVIAGLPGVADAVLTGVPDEIGDDQIVLVLVPEESATAPDAGAFDAAHPLARAVRAALPGLIDAGALPDIVLVTAYLPRSGRSRKLDRAALARAVTAHLAASGSTGTTS